MKRMTKTTILCAVILITITGICQAADFYLTVEATSPRFVLEEDTLKVWGSGLSSTGFSQLTVTDTDVSYDTIKAWYATMLVCKATGWDIRINYDDSTGKILKIIPNN